MQSWQHKRAVCVLRSVICGTVLLHATAGAVFAQGRGPGRVIRARDARVREWIHLGPGPRKARPRGVKPGITRAKTGYRVTIDVPGLGKHPTTGNDELFVSLDIPGWARNGDAGRPAVPTKTLLLPLPDGVGPAVKVVGSSEVQLDNVHVVPAQDPPPDGNFPRPVFRKASKTYDSDNLYPQNNIIHTSIGRMRNGRVLSVVVTPVRVRPRSRQALVAESLEIEVSWGNDVAVDEGPEPPSEYLPTGFTNGVPSKYMVLMDDQYSSNNTLSDFIGWKRQKGYDVVVVKTSDIDSSGAPTHTQIVNYMRGLSSTNYPEYLLIIGDHTAANGVEGLYFSSSYGGWSDLQIACRDNTDYFPDLYHGRLPATDNSSLTSMLTKVLQMDRTPPAGTMYERILVAGQIQDSYGSDVADRLFCETADSLGCYFEQDAGGVDYDCWRAVVNPYGVTSSCQWNPNSILWNPGDQIGTRVHGLFVPESVAISRISQRINEGLCLVQHRDHGSVDGWGAPYYMTSDVNALTNGQYRPLVLSINCLTGAYHSNNNFARAWMEHSAGGAYAVIAAVDVSYSWCNDWLTHGFYAGFLTNYISWHNACSTPNWPEDLPDPGGAYGGPGSATRLGQMLNFGKMYMYEHNDYSSGFNETTFRLFHVFGDPESFVQLHEPRSLTVTHDSIIGRGSVTVEVDTGEGDCQVCLYSGRLGIHAVTNSDHTGETSFGIDTDDTGTVHVTVTKFGCRPYQGTIDVLGSVVGFSAAKYEVLENAGSLLVTVMRQGDLTMTSAVDYATSNGSALAGSDYTAVSGTLHYAVGDTSNSFTVGISDDANDETGEKFYLLLGNCSSNTYRGDQSSAEVHIEDDDGAGELSFCEAAATVGEAEARATVRVRRRNGFSGQVTVEFAASNMTASSGVDYVATNGTLSFADSVSTAAFDVIVLEDVADEPDETIFLSLCNVSGGAVPAPPSNAVLTIEDNDVAGSLAFDSVLYSVEETGTGCTARVVRTGGSDGVVSVDFATSNGTASAGEDYTATNGALTMAHGVTSAVLYVSVLDDARTEGMESFTLRLTGPTGGATVGAAGEAMIAIDDDEATDIAMFADPLYVDVGPTPGGEVTNLHAALQAKGCIVRRFSGITASDFSGALASADILCIPELERGDLGSALTTAAKDVIASFVSDGGGLILNGDSVNHAPAFVNAVFGYDVVAGNAFGSSSITVDAGGTAFEAGPTLISDNNATVEWVSSSLPAGAFSIYEVVGMDRTAVALAEFGGGVIAFLGYDWFDAVPLGSQDGGWDEVLRRAVRAVLEGSDDLGVLPGGALYSSGMEGGPFSPSYAVYTISNHGTSTVPWSAGCAVPWVTVTPKAGVLAAGVTGTVTVAINSSADQLACGAYRTEVAFTNTVSGGVRRRAIELDVLGVASLPFVEGFETGTLEPWWRSTGTANYRTLVASSYNPHGGSYHATMDSAGGNARNELTLLIDLAGYKDIELTFWGIDWNDEAHGPPPCPFTGGYDFDGVAISEDGVSWYEVQDLRTLSGTYAQRTVDLDAAIAAHGLVYNSMFRIRFNHYDNSGIAVDGIGIDDISVTGVLVDWLMVRPWDGLSASGYEGGPFTPFSADYALENMGTSDVPWSVAWASNWVSVTPAAGILAPGTSTNVSVLINPNANGLVPGLYSDTVVFSNHVSGFLQSRDVTLDIAPIPGEIEVVDSLHPGNDRSMPFGSVIVGVSRCEQITVRNTNAVYGLIVDDILLQQGTNGAPWFALSNLPVLPYTVPPGGSETFDVTFAPDDYVSTQAVVLIRSNDEDEPDVWVTLSGRGVEDYLKVAPDAIQGASGHPGGPFVPSNLVYGVSNIGHETFYWSVTHTQSWLEVSPASGALIPGASNSVAVRLTSLADTLPEGVHEDILVYHNETTGMDHSRRVTLTVYTSPEIWVSPTSFNVTNKLNGSVSRILEVGNDGDGALSVTITSVQTGYTPPDSRADVVLNRVDDSTMVLEYEFAEPSIEKYGDYHSVRIEGLRDYLRVGAPIVPVRPATLIVPWGKQVVGVRVSPVESVRLPGVYRLPPAQRAFPLSRPELISTGPPDPAVYQNSEAWPGKYHEEQDVQSQRGYRLLTLGLLPVQYTPPSGRIDYARRLRVEVELVDVDDMGVLRVCEQTERSIAHRSDNPGTLATYPVADHPARPAADLSGGPYEYVLITTPALAAVSGYWNFQALRDARIARGITATLVTTDWIYANYSGTRPDGGTDNQTRIRNFVMDAYAKWGTRYVLLGGASSLVPARMFWVEAYPGMSTTMPVDMYYGCVEPSACTFDGDADGMYGEPTDGVSGADVDLEAEVFVGRAAVENATELSNFVRKVLLYEETRPQHLPRVAMVGEFLGSHFVPPYAKDLMEEIRLGGTSHGYSTTGFENHARPDFYDFNTLTNLYDKDALWTASDAVDLMNAPMHVLNHLGHSDRQYTMKMYNTDLSSVTNTDYCFIYSQGCMPGYFDLDDCFAEEVTAMEHGAFAVVMNARYGWGTGDTSESPSQSYNRQFWDAVFAEDMLELGRANQDSKEDNRWDISRDCMRWCYYELNLFGDPAQRFLFQQKCSWLVMDVTTSTIPVGASTNIEVRFDAAGLGAGVYTGDIVLSSNDRSTPVTNVSTRMTVIPDELRIRPQTGFVSRGPEGGPFAPGSAVYSLTNTGPSSLVWTVNCPAPWIDVSATGGVLNAGADTNITVSLNASANALPGDLYGASVTFSNTVSGVVQLRLVSLDIEATADIPFVEDFENGSALSNYWEVTGTGMQRTEVTSAYSPHAGSGHLTMDSMGGGARNELTLAIDLADYEDVVLTFWAKEFSDEAHGPPTVPFVGGADFDGVAISADGTNWYEVQELRTGISIYYQEFTVDLDAAIAAHGLSYGRNFKIRFNHYDDSPLTVDGFAFDDISIDGVPADDLRVAPGIGLESRGYAGGPFCPSNKIYSLTNRGTSNLAWAVSCSANWLGISPTGGVLVPGATADVAVAVNTNAYVLTVGRHSATVEFTNITSGRTNMRSATVTVREVPGAPPAPFGPVPTNGAVGVSSDVYLCWNSTFDVQTAGPGVAPGVSTADPGANGISISFDDVSAPNVFATTTRLTDGYSSLGVTFAGPGGRDGGAILNDAAGFGVTGHSSPNFLGLNVSSVMSDGGVPRGPETLLFSADVSQVEVAVGSRLIGTATMRAYDLWDSPLGADTTSVSSVMQPLSITATGIASVVLEATPQYFVFDDLVFVPESGITAYDVYLGSHTSSMSRIARGITEKTCPAGALDFSATYYWQVVASNEVGGTTGPVWRFTTALDAVYLSSPAFSVSEGGVAASITVMRENTELSGVTVEYFTSNGTATAGDDYVATTGKIVFAAGQASSTFIVPVVEDSLSEGDETVEIGLRVQSPDIVLRSPAVATLTILDNEGVPAGLPYYFTDGDSYIWDVAGSGCIMNGSIDAYDGGHVLSGFGSFSSGLVVRTREMVIGPYVSGGLEISRRIYVPADQAYARFLEVIRNPTGSALTRDVFIDTNLGSDGSTVLVGTSSGDQVFATNDNWIVTDDTDGAGDPTVLHVIANDGGDVRPKAVSYSTGYLGYDYHVVIPPGETRIVMHFGAQNQDRATALAKAPKLAQLDLDALTGISDAELGQIVNFGLHGIINVSPFGGLIASGYEGGPFSPSNVAYTVTNVGTSDLTWAASSTESWVDVSSAGGVLLPGASTSVLVSLTPAACALPVGTSTGTVVFSSNVGGWSVGRDVRVTVEPRVLAQFGWDMIASTQYVDCTFPVTVTARDGAGDVFPDFTGSVEIVGWVGTESAPTNILRGQSHMYSSVGDLTLGYSFTPTNDIKVTHVRHYFGTKVSIWTESGTLLASENVAAVPGSWHETALSRPIVLSAGTRYRVGAYTGGGQYFYRYDLPNDFPCGTIDVSYNISGDAFPTQVESARWRLVGLRYTALVGEQVAVTPTNSADFVAGVWTGTVTVLETATNMVLRADHGSGCTGESVAFDVVDQLPMTVYLPCAVTEGDGTVTGHVALTRAATSEVEVSLISDDTSEVTVTNVVRIPAGETTGLFDALIIDDYLFDGSRTVRLSATAPGYAEGAAATVVHDNECATLGVLLPSAAREGSTVTGQVTVSSVVYEEVVVALAGDDASEITVPTNVVVPSGQSSAPLVFTTADDTEIDGTQSAGITAHVENWIDGAGSINVLDNEHTNLVVTLPVFVREGDGMLINAGIVAISGTLTNDLSVLLTSDDTTELDIAPATIITAGATSVTFDAYVVNDAERDGAQTARVTAVATGFSNGSAEVAVGDDEGEIRGCKWEDLNTNGVWDPAERGMEGWNIYVDTNTNGQWDVGEPFDVTDTSGNYTIVVTPGLHLLAEEQQAYWTQTFPGTNGVGYTGRPALEQVVTDGIGLPGRHLVPVEPDQVVTNINFGNTPPEPRFTLDVPAAATEGDGTLTGRVSLVLAPESNIVVTLIVDDVTEIALTNTVTIPVGQTNASFEVTVLDDGDLDGPQTVTITASAPEYIAGETTIIVNDDETTTLSVVLPTNVTEGDGVLLGQGVVSMGAVASNDFAVLLSSDDSSELVVSNAVNILAGRSNAVFDLVVIDDGEIDGAQTVMISANMGGWTGGSNSIVVTDNEHNRLLLDGRTDVREGDGVLTGAVAVALSGTLSADLVVTFGTDDPSEAHAVGPVLIPAGATNANTGLVVVDDDITDGTQPCRITAIAAGFVTGTNEISVADNDVHHFVFGPVDDPQTSRVPFIVMLTASDTNDVPIVTYTGTVGIAGAGAGGSLTVAPTNVGPFVGGQWLGSVAVQPVDSNVVLTVDDGLGHTGSSNPFDVYPYPPPPAHSARPAHLATGVLANVSLAWGCGDTNISAVDVTYAVRFGTVPVPGTNELQGTTAARSWALPPLKPYTTYYWQIVSKRDGIDTLGPVWWFTTEGVNHLSWDPLDSPQLVGAGFPVRIAARDVNGSVVAGFTGTVALSGWGEAYVCRADFEDGLAGFTVDNDYGAGGGLWHRSSGRGGESGHSASNALYYGRGEGSAGGGDYDVGNTAGALTSPSIDLTAAEPPVVLSFNYLLETEGYAGYDVAEVMISTNGARFETIAGNQGEGHSLTDPTAGAWVSASVDISAYAGAQVRLRFIFDTIEGTRNNFEGWYIDDIAVRVRGVERIPVQPITSRGFVSGIWTGEVTVGTMASDMYLRAEDGVHTANSTVFDVGVRGALTVGVTGLVTEGVGTVAGLGRITVSVPQTNDVIVSLVSSDPGEATVPGAVILPALSNSVAFDVTVGDDVDCDGAQYAAIVANAVGFESSSGTVVVVDNEVHHFSFGTVRDPQTSAIPFNVTLAACTIDGMLVPSYSGSAALDAADVAGPMALVPTNTGLFALGRWAGAVVIDRAGTNVVLSVDDGAGRTGASVAFDVVPNPLSGPVPADLAVKVGTDTDLGWAYSGDGSNVVFRLYFGAEPVPGTNEFLGTTTNTAWALPPLVRGTTYYWRVEADAGGSVVRGPVWQFSTETITCFHWSTIASPQLMNHPFAVVVTALDACDRTVTGFTGTVDFTGRGVGEPLRADVDTGMDGFSINNTYGVGGGLWHRTIGRGADSGHTASNSFYYGQGEGPAGGGNYDVGNSEGVLVSPVIDLSNATVFACLSFRYLLETEGEVGYDIAAVEVSSNGAPFEVVAGNQGIGTPLLDPTAGNWVSASVDLSTYMGAKLRIRFRFATADETRNAYEGWYVDDIVLRGGGVAPVTIRPDCSTAFMSGIWTGTVTVMEGATDMWLCSDDGNGHIGTSTFFDVGTVTPRGTPVPWLVACGLTNSGPLIEEQLDRDNDGMYAWQEYIADTDPMSAESVLKISEITASGGIIRVEWHGGRQACQYLERRHDLLSTSEQWAVVYTNEPVTSVTNVYDDASDTGTVFYRIKAERP